MDKRKKMKEYVKYVIKKQYFLILKKDIKMVVAKNI